MKDFKTQIAISLSKFNRKYFAIKIPDFSVK
ncbi:hypothetical protein EPYR_03307 [Erwinia pyrifoliae DSM 12163]|nr:hypothetical protein EPYR_03307 [Erwinia pyrifoliae DSM 12163]